MFICPHCTNKHKHKQMHKQKCIKMITHPMTKCMLCAFVHQYKNSGLRDVKTYQHGSSVEFLATLCILGHLGDITMEFNSASLPYELGGCVAGLGGDRSWPRHPSGGRGPTLSWRCGVARWRITGNRFAYCSQPGRWLFLKFYYSRSFFRFCLYP